MAQVTVDIGSLCSGGGHVEIIVNRNGVEVSRQWRSIVDFLSGGGIPFKTIQDAADYLIADTSAPNLTAWRNKIRTRSVEVPDGLLSARAK
jgi:hypothetical protein